MNNVFFASMRSDVQGRVDAIKDIEQLPSLDQSPKQELTVNLPSITPQQMEKANLAIDALADIHIIPAQTMKNMQVAFEIRLLGKLYHEGTPAITDSNIKCGTPAHIPDSTSMREVITRQEATAPAYKSELFSIAQELEYYHQERFNFQGQTIQSADTFKKQPAPISHEEAGMASKLQETIAKRYGIDEGAMASIIKAATTITNYQESLDSVTFNMTPTLEPQRSYDPHIPYLATYGEWKHHQETTRPAFERIMSAFSQVLDNFRDYRLQQEAPTRTDISHEEYLIASQMLFEIGNRYFISGDELQQLSKAAGVTGNYYQQQDLQREELFKRAKEFSDAEASKNKTAA